MSLNRSDENETGLVVGQLDEKKREWKECGVESLMNHTCVHKCVQCIFFVANSAQAGEASEIPQTTHWQIENVSEENQIHDPEYKRLVFVNSSCVPD